MGLFLLCNPLTIFPSQVYFRLILCSEQPRPRSSSASESKLLHLLCTGRPLDFLEQGSIMEKEIFNCISKLLSAEREYYLLKKKEDLYIKTTEEGEWYIQRTLAKSQQIKKIWPSKSHFSGINSLCYFGQVTTSLRPSKFSIYKIRLSKYPSRLGILWCSHSIPNV